jgi:hypothetical protein
MLCLGIVVDSLCAMDTDETAETLLNIAGHQVHNLKGTGSWDKYFLNVSKIISEI